MALWLASSSSQPALVVFITGRPEAGGVLRQASGDHAHPLTRAKGQLRVEVREPAGSGNDARGRNVPGGVQRRELQVLLPIRGLVRSGCLRRAPEKDILPA